MHVELERCGALLNQCSKFLELNDPSTKRTNLNACHSPTVFPERDGPSSHSRSLFLPNLSLNCTDDKLHGAIRQFSERTHDRLSATPSLCFLNLMFLISILFRLSVNNAKLSRQNTTSKTQSNQLVSVKYPHHPHGGRWPTNTDAVRIARKLIKYLPGYVQREAFTRRHKRRTSLLVRWNLEDNWEVACRK